MLLLRKDVEMIKAGAIDGFRTLRLHHWAVPLLLLLSPTFLAQMPCTS